MSESPTRLCSARTTATWGIDLRLVPLAATAWLSMWLVTGGLVIPWWALVIMALIGFAAWHRRQQMVAAVCLVGICYSAVGLIRYDHLASGITADLAAEKAFVEAELQIQGDLVRHGGGAKPISASVRAELHQIAGRGTVARVRLPARLFVAQEAIGEFTVIESGSLIRVRGRSRPVDPGEPFAIVIQVSEAPTQLAGPGWFDRSVNRFRQSLRDAMAASPPKQAGLIPSLVVGDTSAVDQRTAEQFRVTALTHLLAVSGSNLTLVLGFVLGLARWCGIRGWWIRGFAVVTVLAFVAICRAEPSVLRAAAMGMVTLAALGSGRVGRRGIRHLCLAVLILMLLDPWLARSWGFALSVSASAGILWWSPVWHQEMSRWAPGWLSEAICVPLAAQLATQPLVTALSGQISLIGLAANALAGPFVGPATVLGLLAGLGAYLWTSLGMAIGWGAGWSVQPILWAAESGSGLPTPAWQISGGPVTLVALGLACLLVSFVVGPVLSRMWTCCCLIISLLVGSWFTPPVLGWPGTWDVVFCDVGQGDATVLRAGPGKIMLIDTGPDPRPTLQCLRSLGVHEIPLLVLTHYHADHIGGLVQILNELPVTRVMVSRFASPATSARRVRDQVEKAGVILTEGRPGEQITVGEVNWMTIWAGEPGQRGVDERTADVESADENDASVIGVAEVGGTRIMLAGDAEPEGQRAGLRSAAELGADMRAHILKLPHHGSSNQEEDFFRITEASLAIASAGKGNDYGHPARKTLDLAIRLGMQIRRTDRDGSIAVAAAERGLKVRVRGR